MPWQNVTPMEEIIRFVSLAQTDRFTITDLCEQFAISRKTAHKHLERYAAGGLKALQPRSHRPHPFPQRTADAIEQLVLAERRLHRTWGPNDRSAGKKTSRRQKDVTPAKRRQVLTLDKRRR